MPDPATPQPSGPGSDSFVQPQAAWRVTLNGQDLTATMAPRLLGLRLSEKRGEAADELEITLHDADGLLNLPPEGAPLRVALGWRRGTAVPLGLVDKGLFKVDDITWEGPPDKVTITARAADLKDTFRTRKSRLWKDTTIGAIIGQIAGDHGLSALCHPDLAGKSVTLAEQHNKSDMQFLRDLGRRYDAVATVKAGALIFAPVDAKTTPGGRALPTLVCTRSSGDRYSFRRAARQRAQDGAEAQYHDQDQAQRKKVQKGGTNRRRLKRVYASEGDASAAADAEKKRLKRAEASLSLTLAHGDAAIAPGLRVAARGFKSEVDSYQWVVASAEHTMDGSGGFVTSLEMEVAGA